MRGAGHPRAEWRLVLQQLWSQRVNESSDHRPLEEDLIECRHCGWRVTVSVDGGYVCPQCLHTEGPGGTTYE